MSSPHQDSLLPRFAQGEEGHETTTQLPCLVCVDRVSHTVDIHLSDTKIAVRDSLLMQSLYDWIQQQMKTLSRHSDTAKAFAYLLKQWKALNVYCSNGWVEIDNNIAENALRGVAVGRKNWLFAGSDSGGEHAVVLYSLIGTCRLNNVEPEKWLRYVIEHLQDWPANRVRDLLPWKVDLTSQ